MMRGDAESAERRAVLRRGVAGIGLPSIARVAPRQRPHDAVAPHLGDDRGGGDRKGESVATDDGVDRATERRGDVAVDEGAIRADPERGNGARHRQQGGAQDVESVDLAHAGGAERDVGAAARGKAGERAIAFLAGRGAEPLGIVKPVAQCLRKAAGIEDDRGGDDRSGERPPPGLVDTAPQPSGAPFKREIRNASVPKPRSATSAITREGACWRRPAAIPISG